MNEQTSALCGERVTRMCPQMIFEIALLTDQDLDKADIGKDNADDSSFG